jgi:hypothetical protein
MSYLSALKKSSAFDFDNIQKVIDEQNNPKKTAKQNNKDERFWKLDLDKAGNGFATIRFLPPALDAEGKPEDKLWVRMFSHGFRGPTGKWYIEKSLSTIEGRDAIGEYNSALWNSVGDDQPDHPNRKQARVQKRRLRYISNILVVADPQNPQNEGKVFLFDYGKKIYDKLQSVMFPKIPNVPRLNPFDPVAGADFNVIVEQVGGFSNYDQSRFSAPAPLGSNAEIDVICPKAYSLKDLVKPAQFKSAAELKSLLNTAMGFDVDLAIAAIKGTSVPTESAPVAQTTPSKPNLTVEAVSGADDYADDEDDADLKKFKGLV